MKVKTNIKGGLQCKDATTSYGQCKQCCKGWEGQEPQQSKCLAACDDKYGK